MKEEFIAGRNPVAEALRSGRALNKVMVQDGARGVTEIIAAARKKGVAVEFVKSDKLDKLAQGVRHQGVVAYAAPVEFKTLEDALKKAAVKGEAPFLLLLDELQDPQNLGALIRTADAAGVHGILLPKRRSCPLNAVVAKISAGAVEYVPVIQIGNIVQQLKDLKKQGFWVAGAVGITVNNACCSQFVYSVISPMTSRYIGEGVCGISAGSYAKSHSHCEN